MVSARSVRSTWQSIAETIALVVIALAVAWMAVTRSSSERAAAQGGAPRGRPEPALPAQPISLTGAQILGDRAAKIGFVVYSDFQCPYCGKFARETLPTLEQQYVRTGKVLLAFRQFPLAIHQFAEKAAEAAECAGRQGKFWAFHDQLFADQRTLDTAGLQDRARVLGLEANEFARCLEGQTAMIVEADRAGGEPLGVSGTPTFLLGPVLEDGRLKVAQRFSDAQPLAQFQNMLDRLVGASRGGSAIGQR
jgi:protein-disulfide isomerase